MFGKLKEYLRIHTNYGKSRYLNFLYQYDMKRFFCYSSMNRNSDATQTETEIRLLVHSIEKALSLPDVRPGFGREKIESLFRKYEHYKCLTNCENAEEIKLLVAGTIHTYIAFQQEYCPKLDLSFIPDSFRNAETDNRVGVSFDSHCDFSELAFLEFAKSRHSLRYFSSKPVCAETIQKAVSLAQTAPSACNRQSTHVFACMNADMIKEIMSFHGGIKGFGCPQAILVVTGNLGSYTSEYERNTVYVDGGIFVMNLLYALHYYGLATCPVIWGSEPDNDKKLYQMLSIPESDTIVSLVMVGAYPEGAYRFAKAQRKETNTVIRIIK